MLQLVGGCCEDAVYPIAEADFIADAVNGNLVPRRRYRIYDAGYASGAPGTPTDDGVSGFYTRATSATTYEVQGNWQFYSQNKTRAAFLFRFNDADPTSTILNALNIDSNDILNDSISYTGTSGTNTNVAIDTFLTDVQAAINAYTATSGWECVDYSLTLSMTQTQITLQLLV